MPLLLRGKDYSDWRSFLPALGDADLASPLRSTIPLLAYWRQPAEKWDILRSRLGLPVTGPVSYSFEHPISVVRGRGKPSYTDLMVLAPGVAVAIEAKYTEPAYETVGSWLRDPAEPNRVEVLAGWLDLLQKTCGVRPMVDDVRQLSYQLIHRAASACSPAATGRAVVYQVFDDNMLDYYREQIGALRSLLPWSMITLAIHVTPAKAADTYGQLIERWRRRDGDMADEVRSALLNQATFTFTEGSFDIL